jgi:hypothetical protein
MNQQHCIWVVAVCCFTVRPISLAKSTAIQENIQAFIADNGFKYITMIENSTRSSETNLRIALKIATDGTSYLRTLTMDKYQEEYTYKHLDVQIFMFDIQGRDSPIFLQFFYLFSIFFLNRF